MGPITSQREAPHDNAPQGSPDAGPLFVGRQPIFNVKRELHAYELLFRGNGGEHANHCPRSDAQLATLHTIERSFNVIGLRTLVGDKPAFLNMTRDLLLSDTIRMMPPGQVVIELLESVEADEHVLAALRALKEVGFTIALDDFVLTPRTRPLVALADVIKLDLLQGGADACAKLIEQTRRPRLKFLAEKVETHAVFEQMKKLGCSYFQGYFFARPQMLSVRPLNAGKHQGLRLMQLLNNQPVDFAAVEDTLRKDVSLSVKLLTYLNSAALSLRHEVKSIKHAMAMLGECTLRQWACLVAVTSLGVGKPTELARVSMVRARFFEFLATELSAQMRGIDPFLLGLFSLIDAMLDRSMTDAVTDLALCGAMKDALTGKHATLNLMLSLAQTLERGEWENASDIAAVLSLDSSLIADGYCKAMRWADEVMRAQG